MPDPAAPAALPHHERAIARFTAEAATRGSLGVVVVGSVARGTARPDSDVDVYEVVDDARFARALAESAAALVDVEAADWPGGYVDVKLVSPALLERAREEADDPTRASFAGARIAHDGVGGLAALVGAIAAPPAEYFVRSIPPLLAQFALHSGYFLPRGRYHGDRLLTAHAALHAALAAGRVALARTEVLFRGPKYLDEQLRVAGRAAVADAALALLDEPSAAAAAGLARTIDADPGIDDATLSRFIIDNEWAWFTRTPPPEHR